MLEKIDIDIRVNMGEIPLETVEAWASRNEQYIQVTSDQTVIQKAIAMWESKANELGIPQQHIEMSKENFESGFERDLAIIFAREAVIQYFNLKGEEEQNVCYDDEWVRKAVEKAVDWHVACIKYASNSLKHLKEKRLLEAIFGADEDEDYTEEEDVDCDGYDGKHDREDEQARAVLD